MSRTNGDPGPSHRDASPFTNGMGNANTLDNQPFARDETAMPVPSRPTDPRLEGSMRHTGSITALRELVCISLIWKLLLHNIACSHPHIICFSSLLSVLIPVCIGGLWDGFSVSASASIGHGPQRWITCSGSHTHEDYITDVLILSKWKREQFQFWTAVIKKKDLWHVLHGFWSIWIADQFWFSLYYAPGSNRWACFRGRSWINMGRS